MKAKRFFSIFLSLVMIFAFSACGKSKNTVVTDGSTSMEKVIGALGESFENENSDISFTYNPTGSGAGIKAVTEGTCDIGLSSRYLKDEEKAKGLSETVLAFDGIDMKHHSGIISEFRRLYIKTGIFDAKLSQIISILFDIRTESDYDDFFIISKQEVEEQIENAKYFLKEIERFLLTK